VNGVRLDLLVAEKLPERIAQFLECGGSHVVHFLPAHPTVLARNDKVYRAILNHGDLNVIDGVSVEMAARLYGHVVPRTTGTDALALLCDWGVRLAIRHYLFGSTAAVVELMRRRLRRTHPGLRVVGVDAPPFGDVDAIGLEEAAERMRQTHSDLVWVGLGVPKQERVAERLRELNAAPVILCIGAAFDFVSGSKRRAPRWMRRAGLEWFHRLGSEPLRLGQRYLVGNPRFVAGVVRDYVGRDRGC
jgi:N-acetylglucosaminyldiphosphoundecaprenol N-acetyl-beta-D-mannosaminyltransferase